MQLSDSDYWCTPPEILPVMAQFCHSHNLSIKSVFDLDVACTDENALCGNYINEQENAFIRPWNGSMIWCNPPYGRGWISAFINRALDEIQTSVRTKTVVMLLNSDLSTGWFMDAFNSPHLKAIVHIVGGRISFLDPKTRKETGGGKKPNIFLIFNNLKTSNDSFKEEVKTYYLHIDKLKGG